MSRPPLESFQAERPAAGRPPLSSFESNAAPASAPMSTPATSTFGDRFKSSLNARVESVNRSAGAYSRGEQGLGRTLFQAGGQVIGAGADAVAAAIPEPIKKGIATLFKPVTAGIEKAGDKLSETKFIQEAAAAGHELPIERDLQALQEYLNLLPGPKLVGAASKGAAKGLASAKDAVSKGTSSLQRHEVERLANKYREAAGGTLPTRKVLARSEARGKDPAQFLAERNVRPDVKDGKIVSAAKADELHASADPLNEHLDLALKEIQTAVPLRKLSDIEERAVKLARTDKNVAGNTADALEKGIREEFALYRKNYGDNITLLDENAIKRAKWGITKFDATKPLQGDINYLIGKAAKEDIEDAARIAIPDEKMNVVGQLNSHIGDIYDAEKFLRSLDLRAVKGGRLGKYFGRTLGGMIGAAHAGPIGTFFGVLGGDLVIEILQQSTFSNPLKQLILRNLQKTDPAGYTKVMEFIKKAGLERETRPLLPAPDPTRSTINQGRPIPVQQSGKPGVEYVGSETTIGDYRRPKR